MNKKIVSAVLCGAMILGSAVPAMAGTADGKKIALVGKSAGNAFFEIAAKSWVCCRVEAGDLDSFVHSFL